MRTKLFDLAASKKIILSEGLTFLPIAEEFLLKYGGVHFTRFWKVKNGLKGPETIDVYSIAHFNPIRAVESVDSQWFVEYSRRIGKPITPIGNCGQEHASLMIDENGKIYGGFDSELGKIADSPEEAILKFCNSSNWQWDPVAD